METGSDTGTLHTTQMKGTTKKSSNTALQEMFQQDAAQWQSSEANFPYDKITRTLTSKFLVNGSFNVRMPINPWRNKLYIWFKHPVRTTQ